MVKRGMGWGVTIWLPPTTQEIVDQACNGGNIFMYLSSHISCRHVHMWNPTCMVSHCWWVVCNAFRNRDKALLDHRQHLTSESFYSNYYLTCSVATKQVSPAQVVRSRGVLERKVEKKTFQVATCHQRGYNLHLSTNYLPI